MRVPVCTAILAMLLLVSDVRLLGQVSITPPAQQFVLRFYGNQLVQVPIASPFNLGSSFTMECWVYLETASPGSIVMGKATSSPYIDPNFHYVLGFADSTRPQFVQSTGQTGSARIAASSQYIPLRQWMHLAASLSGGVMRLYVNGDSVGGTLSPGDPQQDNSVQFALGATDYLGATGFGFMGAMRQARVWSRALSSSELKTNGVQYLTGDETDLLASWPLDDATGQFVKDQSRNNFILQMGTSASDYLRMPRWTRVIVLETGPYFSIERYQTTKSLGSGRFIDFDNDGFPDLILTQSVPDFVSAPVVALHNDHQGHFSDITDFVFGQQPPTTIAPNGYAVADFTGDGRKGVLIAEQGEDRPPYPGDYNHLLIQGPNGTMVDESGRRLPQIKAFTHAVTAGDVDGDGHVDLFVGMIGAGPVPRFYMNDGKGYFTSDTTRIPVVGDSAAGGQSILLVDIDNDGYPDLFCGKSRFSEDRDKLFINDGKGKFLLAPLNSIPPMDGVNRSTLGIAAADFNNDGLPDLLMSTDGFNAGPGRLRLLLNNGDRTFRDASSQIPMLPSEVGAWEFIFPADFNNDGLMDFIIPGQGGKTSPRLFLDKGGAQFIDATDLLPFNENFDFVIPGDIDNDGKIEIFAASGNKFVVLRSIKPFDVSILPQPTITSISPDSGMAGANVTIIGTNLVGSMDVQFSGKSANFKVVSETQINAVVPAGASRGPIRVLTASGMAQSPSDFIIPLVAYGFVPTSGPIGTSVTISGSSFTGATAVKFGGVNASNFIVVADSEIVAVAPPNAITGPISITTSSATFSTTANFTIVRPPDQRYSLRFGGNQVAIAPFAPQLNLGARFTMEAWVFVEEGRVSTCSIMGKTHDPVANDPYIIYGLQFSGSGKQIEFAQTTDQAGSYRIATAPTDCPINTWTHVAATLDSVTMRLYINGSQVASQASPGVPLNNTIHFSVGAGLDRNAFIATRGLIGSLRQVRVWNRALSLSEIQVNSSRYLAGNDSSLVAYWPLDDSTGQTARDLGPNKLNLTLGTTPAVDNNDPTWITLSGSLAVSGNSLDFGNVIKNSTVSLPVVISNPLFADTRIDSMYNNSQNFAFLTTGFPIVLKRGDSVNVNIMFHPDSLKQFRDTLFIQNNSIDPLVKIVLAGNSPAPAISRSAPVLSFGSVVKDSSKLLLESLTNSSMNRLVIDSIYTGTTRFKADSSRGSAGQTDTLKIVVRFTPGGFGIFVDTLHLRNNSATPLVKIPMSGSSPAPQLAISAPSLSLGPVAVTDTAIGAIKLHNRSSANRLTISQISNKVPAFKFVANLPMTINANDSAQIAIKFNISSVIPNGYGNWPDTLQITSDGGNALVALMGFSPYPSILISPSAIAFGTVKKDSTAQKIFSIQDTSVNSLQTDSLWTRTKYFEVTHTLANHIIKKADSVLVTIRFTPDSSRQFFDTLYVASNSIVSPLKIPLSGNGTTTGVVRFGNEIPKVYALYQNYPNPFNPSTKLRFGIPTRSYVRLKIYNILGQAVQEIVNEELGAGYYEKQWIAGVASGLYFYRIEAISVTDPTKRFVDVKKMLLLK